MNPGQEQFLNFFMERAQDEKKDETKALLEECFAMQNNGTFSAEAMQGVVPKMIACLKPEHIEEVTNIMNNFGKDHVSK